jgi:hypothetical protein
MGHQHGIDLGIADLQDGETDLFRHIIFFRHGFKRLTQALHALTALADHDARLGGVNSDADLGAGNALNLDARDGGISQALHDELAQLVIFANEIAVVAIGIPAGLPTLNDAQPEAIWINFMPQARTSSASG